jgi:c-di-AMP phosphodiesterase-like protein
VVIRDRLDFSFYGGRTRTVEKRTRVKSRVMASALTEMIKDSSRVLIMGHKGPDLDALGAAIGVACICRKLEQPCNIVLDMREAKAILPLYHNVIRLSEYKDIFISAEDALLAADVRTLLVVVDTNRPVVVESPSLLESCTRVALIDHHRRAADYIENIDLNFHEPYASSTSEMVTELITYIMEHQDILRPEAEALLAGITLDTKNFTMRTGVRTFEAAAWLRRAGADTIEVKKLFQDNLTDYIQRSEIVKNTRFYKNSIAISVCESAVDREIAAQAADELLGIRDVTASFVIFPFEDIVYVSGRSLGQVNVQMVLERMGGGGHSTMAAVQLKGKSIPEAYDSLILAINQYTETVVKA